LRDRGEDAWDGLRRELRRAARRRGHRHEDEDEGEEQENG